MPRLAWRRLAIGISRGGHQSLGLPKLRRIEHFWVPIVSEIVAAEYPHGRHYNGVGGAGAAVIWYRILRVTRR